VNARRRHASSGPGARCADAEADEAIARTLREISDDVARRIRNRELTETQARDLAATVRFQMTRMIPDRMDTYDMIYGARFERLIRQFLRGES
jgi:hypothetical protein